MASSTFLSLKGYGVELIAEQTILITGATDGLGKATALALAKLGARVLLHGRDEARLALAKADITAESGNPKIATYRADLAVLAEVRHLAYTVLAEHPALHTLINNAAAAGSPTRSLSADGHEMQFAVNYLAPFLLTRLLLPALAAGAPSRIINVSSAGQFPINFDDMMMAQNYQPLDAYRQSKLAQVMFTFSLAPQVADAGITVNVLHPGSMMPTKLAQGFFNRSMDTLETGVNSVLRLASDPALDGVTGLYFDHLTETRANEQAYDADVRRRLWALSEQLTQAE